MIRKSLLMMFFIACSQGRPASYKSVTAVQESISRNINEEHVASRLSDDFRNISIRPALDTEELSEFFDSIGEESTYHHGETSNRSTLESTFRRAPRLYEPPICQQAGQDQEWYEDLQTRHNRAREEYRELSRAAPYGNNEAALHRYDDFNVNMGPGRRGNDANIAPMAVARGQAEDMRPVQRGRLTRLIRGRGSQVAPASDLI